MLETAKQYEEKGEALPEAISSFPALPENLFPPDYPDPNLMLHKALAFLDNLSADMEDGKLSEEMLGNIRGLQSDPVRFIVL